MPKHTRTALDILLIGVFAVFTLLSAFFSFFLWRALDSFTVLFFALFATLIAITLGSFTVGLLCIGTTKDGLVDVVLDVFVVSWLGLFTFLPAVGTVLVIQNILQGIGDHRIFYVMLLGVCTAFFGTLLYRKIVLLIQSRRRGQHVR